MNKSAVFRLRSTRMQALSLALLTPAILYNAQAATIMPEDGAYAIDAAGGHPRLIMEHGVPKSAGGFMPRPLCTDSTLQALDPYLDLQMFFADHPDSRITDSGDGHYLLTAPIEFSPHTQTPQAGTMAMYTVYAELDFSSPTQGSLTLRSATALFNGEAAGTSTCLARTIWQLQKLNS